MFTLALQARLLSGEIYRPINKMLRQLNVDVSSWPQNNKTVDGPTRKPAHALLPEEEMDEIPVHGPDGK